MGGSGGGGGSAGQVGWPDYLEGSHSALLGAGGTSPSFGSLTVTLEDALETAVGTTNPYASPVVHDPVTQIGKLTSALLDFKTAIEAQNPMLVWDTLLSDADGDYDSLIGAPTFVDYSASAATSIAAITADPTTNMAAATNIDSAWTSPDPSAGDTDIAAAWTDPAPDAASDIDTAWTAPTLTAASDINTGLAAAATISDAVDGFADRLDDQITSEVLPRFQSGMVDINAVQSSAFVLGQAIIEGMRDREVANFDAELTTKLTAQKDQLIGQAYLQDDKILAASGDGENQALAQAYIQDDKILAANADGENKAIAQGLIEQDRLLANDRDGENKAISQAYLEVDKVRGADAAERNKLVASAFLQVDKIDAESAKTRSLINAEMARNKSSIVWGGTDSLMKNYMSFVDMQKAYSGFAIDSARIEYVMLKEEADKTQEYDAKDGLWDLEAFQYAGNVLAAVSGGTNYTPGPTPSQNALGGAFAGAAIGARVSGGNSMGAGAGAILGGIGAYLMGS